MHLGAAAVGRWKCARCGQVSEAGQRPGRHGVARDGFWSLLKSRLTGNPPAGQEQGLESTEGWRAPGDGSL